jgi:hypothetical protein
MVVEWTGNIAGPRTTEPKSHAGAKLIGNMGAMVGVSNSINHALILAGHLFCFQSNLRGKN